MHNSKKNRIGQTTLKRFMTTMALNLPEEEREQLKQIMFGIVMRLDRVSTPEAMEYVDALFNGVDDMEKTLASKRPATRSRAPKERGVRIHKATSPASNLNDHHRNLDDINSHSLGPSPQQLQIGPPFQ